MRARCNMYNELYRYNYNNFTMNKFNLCIKLNLRRNYNRLEYVVKFSSHTICTCDINLTFNLLNFKCIAIIFLYSDA